MAGKKIIWTEKNFSVEKVNLESEVATLAAPKFMNKALRFIA